MQYYPFKWKGNYIKIYHTIKLETGGGCKLMRLFFLYIYAILNEQCKNEWNVTCTRVCMHGPGVSRILQRSLWMCLLGSNSQRERRTEPVGRRTTSACVAWCIFLFEIFICLKIQTIPIFVSSSTFVSADRCCGLFLGWPPRALFTSKSLWCRFVKVSLSCAITVC